MSSQIFKTPIPYLALLIAHLIWGANFVVAKVTLTEFPPMTLAFLRFALASLLLAPFLYAETKKTVINKKDIPQFIFTGILIISLNITFFFEGMKRTTAINASVLSLVIPVLSVIFGWIFMKEKIKIVSVLGVLAGLTGALVITRLPEIFLGNFPPREMLGSFLIIIASITWVWGSVVAKKLLKKYPSQIVTTFAFLTGTLTFFPPAAMEYLQNPAWINHITGIGIFGLIYMTLLSSISAYFLFEWGLSKTSVTTANLIHYIEPIAAGALAVLVLSENISYEFILGTILIICGVYLGTLSVKSHHRTHKLHRV